MEELLREYSFKESTKIGKMNVDTPSKTMPTMSSEQFKRLGQSLRMTQVYVKEPNLLPNLAKIVLHENS